MSFKDCKETFYLETNLLDFLKKVADTVGSVRVYGFLKKIDTKKIITTSGELLDASRLGIISDTLYKSDSNQALDEPYRFKFEVNNEKETELFKNIDYKSFIGSSIRKKIVYNNMFDKLNILFIINTQEIFSLQLSKDIYKVFQVLDDENIIYMINVIQSYIRHKLSTELDVERVLNSIKVSDLISYEKQISGTNKISNSLEILVMSDDSFENFEVFSLKKSDFSNCLENGLFVRGISITLDTLIDKLDTCPLSVDSKAKVNLPFSINENIIPDIQTINKLGNIISYYPNNLYTVKKYVNDCYPKYVEKPDTTTQYIEPRPSL